MVGLMKKASKTEHRIMLLDSIMSVISNKEIYDTIDYKRKNEEYIKQFMYQPLLRKVAERYRDRGFSYKTYMRKAKNDLIWESNKQTTLHNMVLFGTQHRPDMELNVDGVSIAIEVKRGMVGSDIRQGIGQCIVYSAVYDFVVFLFIDTSDDKRILNSMKSDKERVLGESLWDNYNVMFGAV